MDKHVDRFAGEASLAYAIAHLREEMAEVQEVLAHIERGRMKDTVEARERVNEELVGLRMAARVVHEMVFDEEEIHEALLAGADRYQRLVVDRDRCSSVQRIDEVLG